MEFEPGVSPWAGGTRRVTAVIRVGGEKVATGMSNRFLSSVGSGSGPRELAGQMREAARGALDVLAAAPVLPGSPTAGLHARFTAQAEMMLSSMLWAGYPRKVDQ